MTGSREGVTVSSGRLEAYDIARGLAFLGMVIVNYRILLSGLSPVGPDWLNSLTGVFTGRAAALFVVVAGAGISLMASRAKEKEAGLAAFRFILCKRALFLVVLGYGWVGIWPADILHFYGFYFLFAAAFVSLPGIWLWVFTGTSVAGFTMLYLVVGFWDDWNLETLEYRNFWEPWQLVKNLVFNGFHPLLPWLGFLFAGMWLGRQDLVNRRTSRRVLVTSALVAVCSYLLAWFLAGALEKEPGRAPGCICHGTSTIGEGGEPSSCAALRSLRRRRGLQRCGVVFSCLQVTPRKKDSSPPGLRRAHGSDPLHRSCLYLFLHRRGPTRRGKIG